MGEVAGASMPPADRRTRMAEDRTLPGAAAAHALDGLISVPPHAITSRVIARTAAGNVTLFGFDAGEGLSEHTAPFDALVVVLDGQLQLTIGGARVTAGPHDFVRMPAHVPHALAAVTPVRLLLVMLREAAAPPSL